MTEKGKNDQQEVGLYEKLAERTAELLDTGKKTLDEALKMARDEMAAAEQFSRERLDKVSGFVRRDVALMGENISKTTETLKNAVDPQRVATGIQSVFGSILNSTADLIGDLAERLEKNLEFKTGEVTNLGTLTCKACKAELHMKGTGHIPPCPKCHATVFRKSY